MLQLLINWIIAGPRNKLETARRKHYIDKTNNITQLIYQAIKSDSQLRYQPTSDSNDCLEYKGNLFSVSLGLLINTKIRSKNIINILANLNFSISCQNVLRIKTDIPNAVVQGTLKNTFFISIKLICIKQILTNIRIKLFTRFRMLKRPLQCSCQTQLNVQIRTFKKDHCGVHIKRNIRPGNEF